MRATASAPSLLTNGTMMDAMHTVDSEPLWSILDQKGTQTMMKQVLGEAGSVADFESVRKRLIGSWYSMNFQHGVKFDLTIATGDSFAAATVSSLLTAAVIYRKMSGSETEKAALSRNRHHLEFRPADDPLRHIGHRLQQPAQVIALPKHGALKQNNFVGTNPGPPWAWICFWEVPRVSGRLNLGSDEPREPVLTVGGVSSG